MGEFSGEYEFVGAGGDMTPFTAVPEGCDFFMIQVRLLAV